MATTITPEELYFGAPVSLTYGGTEVGATVDAPKVSIEIESYAPEFQNAKGPVVGTVIVTKVTASAEFTVNQITAEKLAWAMPGCEEVGGSITWTPGRVDSSAYKDLVMVGPGLDGRTITFTLINALSASPFELDFSNSAVAGLKVKMVGYYDADAPTEAPFSIDLAGS